MVAKTRNFIVGLALGLILGGPVLAWAVAYTTGGGAAFNGGTFDDALECTAADTETVPCYSWDGDENTGMFNQAAEHIGLTVEGNEVFRLDGTTLEIETSLNLGTIGSTDVQIARDAANILAVRRGAATAQEVRIYNTDSGADDEFGSIGWVNEANEFHVVTEATGAGTARSMTVGTGGVASLLLRTNATDQWQVDGTGNLFPVLDAQENLGSAGVAPLDLFVSDQILMTTAGLAGDPSYSWNGDPDTGIYSAGGDQIGFSVGGGAEGIFFSTLGFRPASADSLDLGSATNEWSNLYVTSTLQLGLAQDVILARDAADAVAVREPDDTAETVIAFTNNVVNASAGATITCTSCIPAGSLVLGVTTRVTTAFGTTNGLTSLDIGDIAIGANGPSSRLWGDNTGITLGTTTDITDFVVVNPAYYTVASDIIINGNGGTGFDSTGQIRVIVHYIRLDAPAS